MIHGFHATRMPAGFTLVELMVVLALIGILTALVIPEMRGTYSAALLRAGGRDLVDVCSIAASRAVSFRQVHRVRIDPATGKFRVEKRLGGSGSDAAFSPVRGVTGCDGELDGRITAQVRASTAVGSESVETAEDDPATGKGGLSPVAGPLERRPAQDVSFYPDGTSDRSEIVLKDREGFGLVLRLNPVTARVRVLEMKQP